MERPHSTRFRKTAFDDEAEEEKDAAFGTIEAFATAKQFRSNKKSKCSHMKGKEQFGTRYVQYDTQDFGDGYDYTDDTVWLPDCEASSSGDSPVDSFVSSIRKSNLRRQQMGRRKEAAIHWKEQIFGHVDHVLKYRMQYSIPKATSPHTSRACIIGGCQDTVQWVCRTCRDIGKETIFCANHVAEHEPFAHTLEDTFGQTFIHADRRAISCKCTAAPMSSCVVRLHRLNGVEDVRLKACEDCKVVDMLMKEGFFPSSTIKPSKTNIFHISRCE